MVTLNSFALSNAKYRLSVLMIFFLLMFGQAAAVKAADSSWQARYWSNKNLSGDPVLVRSDKEINFDWGDSEPDPVIPKGPFSARWTRSVYFPGGNYRFTATTDDGMRVWVDNNLIIDSWWDSQVHSMSKDIHLSSGDHHIKVEYYEAGGKAVAKLNWTPIGNQQPGTIVNWRGEYYNNMNLSGQPALVRDDGRINFDWGTGSPEWNVVGADNFSARWTRVQHFSPGRYKFTIIVDDGVRLWINGQLVLDKWVDSLSGTYFVEQDFAGGPVSLQMEYYENQGGAVAKMDWFRIGDGSGGSGNIFNWRGEYFNNKTLSGNPTVTRDDAHVNFNWGTSAPVGGVNNDNFSVRWTRSLNFVSGRYRFTATSDDGVRVWVNNQLIIDNWSDHAAQAVSGDIDLPTGVVPIRVEYYDSGGSAQMQLAWAAIGSAPTPQPQPQPGTNTATVVSSELNVRSGPGMQYSILSVLKKNQVVNLAGYRSADGNWVLINWNGSTAWVSARPAYLKTSANIGQMPVQNVQTPDPGGATATVTGVYHLNLRSGPGTSFSIIKSAPAGTVVTLLGRNRTSTWAQVRLADGSVGWMNAGFLTGKTKVSSLPLVN